MCVATMPDTCKTPSPGGPAPLPYPNIGMVRDANNTCAKVQIQKKDAVTIASKIPQSKGDEAGTLGGVISGVNMSQIAYKKASSKVFAKGKKVAHLVSPTAHNGSNANAPLGAQTVPSQAHVFVAP